MDCELLIKKPPANTMTLPRDSRIALLTADNKRLAAKNYRFSIAWICYNHIISHRNHAANIIASNPLALWALNFEPRNHLCHVHKSKLLQYVQMPLAE
jgi:hypothetical protein